MSRLTILLFTLISLNGCFSDFATISTTQIEPNTENSSNDENDQQGDDSSDNSGTGNNDSTGNGGTGEPPIIDPPDIIDDGLLGSQTDGNSIMNNGVCVQGCFDMGSCTNIGDAINLEVIPSFNTAAINGPTNNQQDSIVFYKQADQNFWYQGQDMVVNASNNQHTVLFNLSEDTSYEVMVKHNGAQTCESFTTKQPYEVQSTTDIWYVDANSSQDNQTGSLNQPFTTISQALASYDKNNLTTISVAAGSYFERLNVRHNSNQMLQIIGEQGATLDGMDREVTHSLNWQLSETSIYVSDVSGVSPYYLLKDNKRQYKYESKTHLLAGTARNNNQMPEGFYYESNKLWVRSLTPPQNSVWVVSGENIGFHIYETKNLLVQGFEIKNFSDNQYSRCIDITDSNNIIINDNLIHDCGFAGIWARKSGGDAQITNNTIYQTNDRNWTWSALKATSHENTAIRVETSNAIVSGNQAFDMFNGILAGNPDELYDVTIAANIDVFNNYFHHIGDDGLEPEGTMVNARFWNNRLHHQYNAVSIAPISQGPTWFIGNQMKDFTVGSFKVSRDSQGPVLLFHNSADTSIAGVSGISDSGNFNNMTFINNSISATRYGFAKDESYGSVGNFLNYNNFYSYTASQPVYSWDGTKTSDNSVLCGKFNLQCDGISVNPGFADDSDFGLQPNSGLIDVGKRLMGINDRYSNTAPDIGAAEYTAQ